LGWFAVTGSERCGHGFNGGNAGVCGVSGILYSFKDGLPRRWKRYATQNRSFSAACGVVPFPNVLIVWLGISGIKAADRECSPHTVKGPTLTSKSTMLGWGTLRFNLLFD